MNRFRFVSLPLVAVVGAASMGAPSNAVAAKAASPRLSYADMRAEAAFLKRVPRHATLAQIKRLLPRRTRFSAPRWKNGEHEFGNYIEFRGPVSGKLAFVNAAQEKMREQNKNQKALQIYKAGDPLHSVFVVMSGHRPQSRVATGNTADQTRIHFLSRLLGEPRLLRYSPFAAGGPITDHPIAEWTVRDRFLYFETVPGFTWWKNDDRPVSLLAMMFRD